MTQAIQFQQTGGPEVLQWLPVTVGDPGPGQLRVRHEAVGLNYIDTYFRKGLYPIDSFPSGIGKEAAGVVDAVGAGVTNFAVGDRIVYATLPFLGAYSQQLLIPAHCAVKIPDGISLDVAAAAMLKGLTAHYLLFRSYPVRQGDAILIHAAGGGVGLMLCQWGRFLGATVIGTVRSEEKAELARRHGCQYVINTRQESLVRRVREVAAGEGVAVVYDGVGKAVFMDSLDCLKPLGYMVTYGNASGPVPAVEPLLLAQKGSLFLTRPVLFHYTARREDLEAGSAALFDVLQKDIVTVHIGQRYALKDAAEAHRDLESGKTTGTTVLIP